jgi:orotate phosphoribosyltransferase
MRAFEASFLNYLLERGALKFGKFTLKSGKTSPYFVNIATAMNTGKGASLTASAYTSKILNDVGLEFDYLHGPAYKGIPIAALISAKLYELEGADKRWGYDRKEAKDYGDTADKFFVGDMQKGDRVLMLDDVITDGGTKLKNFEGLIDLGLEPVAILVAVDRGELTAENQRKLDEMGVKIHSILRVEDLLKVGRHVQEENEKYFTAIT